MRGQEALPQKTLLLRLNGGALAIWIAESFHWKIGKQWGGRDGRLCTDIDAEHSSPVARAEGETEGMHPR